MKSKILVSLVSASLTFFSWTRSTSDVLFDLTAWPHIITRLYDRILLPDCVWLHTTTRHEIQNNVSRLDHALLICRTWKSHIMAPHLPTWTEPCTWAVQWCGTTQHRDQSHLLRPGCTTDFNIIIQKATVPGSWHDRLSGPCRQQKCLGRLVPKPHLACCCDTKRPRNNNPFSLIQLLKESGTI